MKHGFRLLAAVLGVTLLGSLSGAVAVGQCGGAVKKVSSNMRPFLNSGSVKLASFSEERRDRWGDEREQDELEPIVGLWKISFTDTSKGYSDVGYAAWHSDFTEFQNSERTPSTGAVCQGVWEKVGRSKYRLNHFALAYGDSVNLTNIIRIREEVTVDRGRQSFHGTFTTDIYDTSHNLLVEFTGPITGTRITIDTDITSQ